VRQVLKHAGQALVGGSSHHPVKAAGELSLIETALAVVAPELVGHLHPLGIGYPQVKAARDHAAGRPAAAGGGGGRRGYLQCRADGRWHD
jgi:hypothetical protein